MKDVSHPLIATLVYAFQSMGSYYFVLEYCPAGNLYQTLRIQKTFGVKRALLYFAELLCAINHLHKLGILFRDLKAENVLLDAHGHAKLADFGLARNFSPEMGRQNFSYCGSPIYIAPETVSRQAYDQKVDYYALGVLLYEMVVGRPPFNYKKPELIKKAKVAEAVQYPKSLDPKLVNMLKRCLHRDPDKRNCTFEIFAKYLSSEGIDVALVESEHTAYDMNIRLDTSTSRTAIQEFQDSDYDITSKKMLAKMQAVDKLFYFDRDLLPEESKEMSQKLHKIGENTDNYPEDEDDFKVELENSQADIEQVPYSEYKGSFLGDDITNLPPITMPDIGLLPSSTIADLDLRKLLQENGMVVKVGKENISN